VKIEIVCAGIGGRGVLLASSILIEAAIRAGHHAMASDEYGMSQRGGSVVSLVKVGSFESPLIGRENADMLLAFEESEFYRNLTFLKKGGFAIINSAREELPRNIQGLLKKRKVKAFLVNADGIAMDGKVIQASNMAVLGFFSHLSVGPFTCQNLKETILERTKGKSAEKNLEIFEEGYKRAGVAQLPKK
jgi:indolepyruvate ferredoxin oxidoreductase, beta subunit